MTEQNDQDYIMVAPKGNGFLLQVKGQEFKLNEVQVMILYAACKRALEIDE